MAPLVLALVLGPLMEKSFRQTLIAEQGNAMAFVERPLSGAFIAVSVVFFLLPLLKHAKRLRGGKLLPLHGRTPSWAKTLRQLLR